MQWVFERAAVVKEIFESSEVQIPNHCGVYTIYPYATHSEYYEYINEKDEDKRRRLLKANWTGKEDVKD